MSVLTPETRAELGDLLALFAWSLDHGKYGRLREVFTPDVRYTSASHDCHTVEELIDLFEARTGPRTTRHCLGGLLLTGRADGSVQGDSTWHTWATNGTDPDGPVRLYMVADFDDRFVLTDVGWRIAERVITPVLRDATLAPGAT